MRPRYPSRKAARQRPEVRLEHLRARGKENHSAPVQWCAKPADTGIFSPQYAPLRVQIQQRSKQILRQMQDRPQPCTTDPRKIHANYSSHGGLIVRSASADELRLHRYQATDTLHMAFDTEQKHNWPERPAERDAPVAAR